MAYALLSTMPMYSMLSTAVICCHLAMLSKVIVVLFSFRFKWSEWRNDRLADVSLFARNDESQWLVFLKSTAEWTVYLYSITYGNLDAIFKE